jgi:UDP-N-acetylmuramoyl-L-alanyl-D-glutamate--2,6-diaminopimelate ligase
MKIDRINCDPDIAGLTADSRAVAPGYLFAALPGEHVDGRAFITDALTRGATAILAQTGTELPANATDIPLVASDEPRRGLALMAARFYGGQPQIAAAVTGTNGKTSVAWFTQQIWTALGHKSAALGTLGVVRGENKIGEGPGLTTADPVALHRDLRGIADEGVNHVVIEASSHGLDQARLDGVKFTAGAFTNLTRDHLDYHGTLDAYRTAKLRLFDTVLPPGATAVLNTDCDDFPIFSTVARTRGLKLMGYGRTADEIRLNRIQPLPDGQLLEITLFGQRHEITLALPGVFQARNALCALGLAVACGDDPEAVLAILPELKSPPGRMELVARTGSGAPVYVDYAHTPDALASVLGALRPHSAGKLTVVFGCGGDRDRGKRPRMGAIARDLADTIIVTDDNPRSEDAGAIRREILTSCAHATEIGDRAEAIHHAIAGLGPDDVLVVAGKGHETGQIVGDRILPFDDAETVRAAITLTDG